MLTEERKTTIGLEEAYRAEVREKLAARRPRGALALVWRFLNSNVVVWFLGSVVATSIVILIDSRDERKAATQLEQKLDTEIAARLYRIRGYLKKMEAGEATVLNVADVLRSAGPVRDQPYPMGVFSEYSSRTLESLLWELATTVQDEERMEIVAAMNAARALRDIEGEINAAVATEPSLKCKFILRIYREMDAEFGLERWNISRAKPVLDEEAATGGCTTPVSLIVGKSVKEDSPKSPTQ